MIWICARNALIVRRSLTPITSFAFFLSKKLMLPL